MDCADLMASPSFLTRTSCMPTSSARKRPCGGEIHIGRPRSVGGGGNNICLMGRRGSNVAAVIYVGASLSAGGGELEVCVDGSGGSDDLGGDGLLVEVALQDVDLERALLADPHLGTITMIIIIK